MSKLTEGDLCVTVWGDIYYHLELVGEEREREKRKEGKCFVH